MPRRFTLLALSLLLAGCRAQKRPPALQPTPPFAVRLVCIDFITMEAVEASGFLVTRDGLLVTCAHVVKGTVPIGVTLPNGTDATVAELVASDPDADLALLRIGGDGFRALPLADGQAAHRMPLRAVTKDGVAGAAFVGPHEDPDVRDTILFAAPGLGVGASGGALVDAQGRVVGVIRGAVEDNPAECVAVPVARLRALLVKARERPGEL